MMFLWFMLSLSMCYFLTKVFALTLLVISTQYIIKSNIYEICQNLTVLHML